jgi:deoxyribose-phosphate aldolase
MANSLTALIDHAILHPTMTEAELRSGCKLAANVSVASVCVKPYAVPSAVGFLEGSGVAVSTVVGFPHGANTVDTKMFETRTACQQGAQEIDMVINIAKAVEQDWGYLEDEIRAVVDTAHSFAAIVKVIFETDYISDDTLKIELCRISGRAGAEFVKTSTGFGFVKQPDGQLLSHGATEHDVRLMREHAGPHLQVKASGGIRSFADAQRMVELGATRLGTSATKAIAQGESDAGGGDDY